MTSGSRFLTLVAAIGFWFSPLFPAESPSFARLKPLPAPRVVASAEEYPGGNYSPQRLLDGDPQTAFASNGKGTATFVEFDFGKSVRIAAFKHVERRDPATVKRSQLTLVGSDGTTTASAVVRHVNRRGEATFFALREPTLAQRVRWQVTELGSRYTTVGGAEVVFYTAGTPEPVPRAIDVRVRVPPVVKRAAGGNVQALELTLAFPYATAMDAVVRVEGQKPKKVRLSFGEQKIRYTVPAMTAEQPLEVAIEHGGHTVSSREVTLKPAPRRTIYLLPHSHTDIGYTQLQTEIEDKQIRNLLQGMEYARKTATYPPGARFVWNVEVLWAADLYLRRLNAFQRRALFEAVKEGQVELCGMYLNELTGLCRPEELMRLFRFATELRERTGTSLDAAMISDVPGSTWGTVSAMAQAGIKYFSVAPNYFDRVGDILVQWENKPFYWVGPSGRDKVLVWIPFRGYATSHIYRDLTPAFVELYQTQLEESGYPYDIAYLRWAGHGDNAVPDPSICDFVKEWNATHEWPRFIIAGAHEAFSAFEKRYGDRLPHFKGDWTPYWEDGAGSSARETAMNRASSDRLVQAEALWAMGDPGTYPVEDFREAWRNVLLYSEHTWGAWCSVSQPVRRETREQWQVKRSFALAADLRSRALLSRSLAPGQHGAEETAVDVLNTTSWKRTDLVILPKHLCEGRGRVIDEGGQPIPTQWLRSGELALLAQDVPPLSLRRYVVRKGAPYVKETVTIKGATLDNGIVRVRLDERTGGLAELYLHGLDENLVDDRRGRALNDYLYLVGDDPSQVRRNGAVRIAVAERGPLVASLAVESDAPGCFQLRREVRLVAGRDVVELFNVVDKKRIVAQSYHAKEGKESVNFAFAFNVPDGQVRLQVPFGVVRPDADQIPGACKNWFTVGRWADVSNEEFGVTWVTLDAPLVQVGGITATLLNSQTNPAVWRKQVGPTQELYSWAMNNHWGTNYRAFQEGPVVLRFALHPHRGVDHARASRVAIGLSQPLRVVGSRGSRSRSASRLVVGAPNVLVTGLKPSDDGRAIIVRLWEAAGRDTTTTIAWSSPEPHGVWKSDLSEAPHEPIGGSVTLPAWSVLTLRAQVR